MLSILIRSFCRKHFLMKNFTKCVTFPKQTKNDSSQNGFTVIHCHNFFYIYFVYFSFTFIRLNKWIFCKIPMFIQKESLLAYAHYVCGLCLVCVAAICVCVPVFLVDDWVVVFVSHCEKEGRIKRMSKINCLKQTNK